MIEFFNKGAPYYEDVDINKSNDVGYSYSSKTHVWLQSNEFLDWAKIAQLVFDKRNFEAKLRENQ